MIFQVLFSILPLFYSITISPQTKSWSIWSDWSSCNVTCGYGFAQRSRNCTNESYFKPCDGENSELKQCLNVASCKTLWSEWSIWSICNVSCGNGFKNRTRLCDKKNNTLEWCLGNSTEIIGCFDNTTCEELWFSWSTWSSCVQLNGIGTKKRSRKCKKLPATGSCFGKNTEETNCSQTPFQETFSLLWNVSFERFSERSFISMKFGMFISEMLIGMDNLKLEYFLPSYFDFLNESHPESGFIKTGSNRLKYKFSRRLVLNEFVTHNVTATLNKAKCSLSGDFTMDISMKLSYQNTVGKVQSWRKTYRKNITCLNIYPPTFPKNMNSLPESYGRGIYWDAENSVIYVCMNQHVKSEKTACYSSNDDGSSWKGLDTCVGSVIGHHSETKELYAIHRNQKIYLKFHHIHKKWLALTNQYFKDTAIKYLSPRAWRNLEDNLEVIRFGTSLWMGNAEGLFSRKYATDLWELKVNWHRL